MKTKCKHVKILMTRKTNKVANELNKLGVGKKKTKSNRVEGNTPHRRKVEMERRWWESCGLRKN